MNDTNQSSEVKTKNITLVSIIAWVLGVGCVLTGIGTLISKPLVGILYLLAAAVLIPPVCRSIQKKMNINLSRNVKILIVVILFFIIGTSMTDSSAPKNEVASTPPATTSDNLTVGQEGYIRLPNNPDPTQIICLGTTKGDADKIGDALLAKDYMGLLEIPGAFCVHNGTKALLIEKSFPLRRVRITEAYQKIDQDKVGLAGWLPMEWVVSK